MININLLSDLKTAEKMPYEGIGLYRTEMPFLVSGKTFADRRGTFHGFQATPDGTGKGG